MVRKKKRLIKRMENATKSRSPYAVKMPSFDAPEEADLPVELAAFIAAAVVGVFIIAGFAAFYGTQTIETSLEDQTVALLRVTGFATSTYTPTASTSRLSEPFASRPRSRWPLR